jgi:hypothetical protein
MVEGVDLVVAKEPAIAKVVAVAMAVREFRNRMTGTVGTVVFVGIRCRNVGNCNMNNGNRNANRVKTRLKISSQTYVLRVVCQL